MIICTTEEQKKSAFDMIKSDGFASWHTPMYLDSDRVWDDDGETPQVQELCPHCRLLTDRHFNMTDSIDGWYWMLNHCISCDAVWFDKEKFSSE